MIPKHYLSFGAKLSSTIWTHMDKVIGNLQRATRLSLLPSQSTNKSNQARVCSFAGVVFPIRSQLFIG